MADIEDLRALNSGDVDLVRRDLNGADLTGLELAKRDFSHADLSGANISGADLSASSLQQAKTLKLRAVGANLTSVNGALTVFHSVNFSKAKFRSANFTRSHFAKCAFSGADLSGAYFQKSTFEDGNVFAGAIADDATLFDGANIRRPLAANSVFRNYGVERGELVRLLSAPVASKEEQGINADALPIGRDTEASRAQIAQLRNNLNHNKRSIVLSSASVIEQIGEFRERIRGHNGLPADLRVNLLSFLDELLSDMEALIAIVPENDQGATESQAHAIKSWSTRFANRLASQARELREPERVADIGLPVGIILACGGIAAMVSGGVVGFGVGSFVGKLITNQLKPGEVATKVEKALEDVASNKAP